MGEREREIWLDEVFRRRESMMKCCISSKVLFASRMDGEMRAIRVK